MGKLILFILITVTGIAHAEERVLKFGAMLHLTGEFALQGEAFQQGVQLAAEKNKVEVVYEDTLYKPLQSHTAAKRLAGDPQILGVVVSTLLEAKASAPIFEKNKIPTIVLWDSSPELDQAGNYIFSIGPWAPATGEASAAFAKEDLKAETAVILQTQTEWSNYVSDFFEKDFKTRGGKILARHAVDPAELDFRTVILKTKKLNPGVIYAPVDGNILQFFKQFRGYDIKTPLITSDIIDKELFDTGGDLFEGMYQSQTADADLPETKELINLYQKKFNKAPDYLMYTSWGYDAINILTAAAIKSQNNREKMKDAIYATQGYKGASGEINFSTTGSAPRPVAIFKVEGRKLNSVKK